jgi:ryanodine receptor 2
MVKFYHPQPIDTSEVDLSGLQSLVETLARNAHEVWAQQRVKGGWSWGAQRDDARKHHPCLVPYEELPQQEKIYDRALVTETLKAAIALGFRITRE